MGIEACTLCGGPRDVRFQVGEGAGYTVDCWDDFHESNARSDWELSYDERKEVYQKMSEYAHRNRR